MKLHRLVASLALLATGGLIPLPTVHAADDVKQFLETSFQEVLGIVYDPASASAPLSERLASVVRKHFDLEYTTRSAIGRAGWEKLSAVQRERAIELFSRLVLRTYADRFEPNQSRPEIKFGEPARTGDRCEVPSTITYEGETYQVSYRLRLVNGAWRFYDIIAENISMVRNYRDQFDAILARGGTKALMKALEDSVQHPPETK